MTVLNHVTTGIAIAIVVRNPVLAPLLALLSHFVLDAIPHFDHPAIAPNATKFRLYVTIEALTSATVITISLLLFSSLWLLIAVCAFAAYVPDLLWYYRYFAPDSKIGRWLRPYLHWAQAIQRYEKPPGLIIEALYFLLMGLCIINAAVRGTM